MSYTTVSLAEKRQIVLTLKLQKLETLQRTYDEAAAEFVFLENGGNILDFKGFTSVTVSDCRTYCNTFNLSRCKDVVPIPEDVSESDGCSEESTTVPALTFSNSEIKKTWYDKSCCAVKCFNPSPPFFSFPSVERTVKGNKFICQESIERCKIWAKNSGNKMLLATPVSQLHKKFKLCANHFKTDGFSNLKHNRLHPKAIPSLFDCDPICDYDIASYVEREYEVLELAERTQNPVQIQIPSASGGTMCSSMTSNLHLSTSSIENVSVSRQLNLTCSTKSIECPMLVFSSSTLKNLPSTSKEGDDLSGNKVLNLVKGIQSTVQSPEAFCSSKKPNLPSSIRNVKKVPVSVKLNRKCAAKNCSAVSGTFHSYPATKINGTVQEEGLARCREWIRLSGNELLLNVSPSELHRKYFLCSSHFETDQYYNIYRKRLLPSAIPSLFSEVPLNEMDMEKFPVQLIHNQKVCARQPPSQDNSSSSVMNIIDHSHSCQETRSNDGMISTETGTKNCDGDSISNSSEYPKMDEFQIAFETEMDSLEWREFNACKEKFFIKKKARQKCCHSKTVCAYYTAANDMDPGDIPPELQGLTSIEEQLIAPVRPVLSVYKLKGHQYGYSGNVINFPQDVESFAKKLPHKITEISSMITVRTTKGKTKHKDFQVRADVVKAALTWLQKNNPYFFNIEISQENIDLLPTDGNMYDYVKGIDMEGTESFENEYDLDECGEEEYVDKIEETCIPTVGKTSEKSQIENILDWPSVGNSAINEFQNSGYVVQAFPCLFPYGKCDLNAPRQKNITAANFFKHLMKYKDGRFATHSRFRFFALNTLMRRAALCDGGIFIKRFPEFKNMKVSELKQKLEADPSLMKKIMFQSSNIRGTKSYWHARGEELLSMVEQLGLPTLFITLSAADLHWPDLFKLLAPEEDITTMSDLRRRQLVQDNPMVVDAFFMERVNSFFGNVLVKKFKVKDFWFRIEYQHRGSPHVHGVLWIYGAPDVSGIYKNDVP